MQTMIYNNLSGYLKKEYGHRLKKICIAAGFSCPNRDGKCSTGGCIFCGERGAGEHIDPRLDISEQVRATLSASHPNDEFIAYFQNFTNTYADVKTLKERYDAALISERIRVLAIGTRPDCIDEDIATLIASYKNRFEVWVELGLQTANDVTAKLINRGYTRDVFDKAYDTLSRHGIKCVVHLIVGLPGESRDDYLQTAKYVRDKHPFGVKIHSLYVMKNTRLAELYHKNLYTPLTFDEYTEATAEIIRQMPSDTVIHRITGDCPKDMLIAPEWSRDKNAVINRIREILARK